MVHGDLPRQHPFEVYWPCAGGLSAMNAVGTKLCDPILGRNPVSKHQIQPEYGDKKADAGRDCRTLSRKTKFSGANADRENIIFPVQLATSRIGNLTRLIHTLAICDDLTRLIHTLCMVITYSIIWISQVRLPILLVVSRTGKINIFLFPFAPDNLVSRDGFGRPVPRQPAHSAYSGWIWYFVRVLYNHRDFQHAHFIPIVGVGKRGAY